MCTPKVGHSFLHQAHIVSLLFGALGRSKPDTPPQVGHVDPELVGELLPELRVPKLATSQEQFFAALQVEHVEGVGQEPVAIRRPHVVVDLDLIRRIFLVRGRGGIRIAMLRSGACRRHWIHIAVVIELTCLLSFAVVVLVLVLAPLNFGKFFGICIDLIDILSHLLCFTIIGCTALVAA